MKKLYTLLVIALVGYVGTAQIINFPDADFKQVLLNASSSNYIAKNLAGSYTKVDTNNDGAIQQSEALQISYLNVSNSTTSLTISNLSGIEYFTNLLSLNCANQSITSLNLTGLNNLTTLRCGTNNLTALDISTLNSLVNLYCDNNSITQINLNTHLTELACQFNQLVDLDESNLTNLTTLDCRNNLLNNLIVTNLTNLVTLWCHENQITSLNLLPLTNLQDLNFGGNPGCTYDLSTLVNLRRLNCGANNITSLDLSNQPLLTSLSCRTNQLTALDLSHQPLLTFLDCSYNLLTTLDLSTLPLLNYIECAYNHLNNIFIKNGKLEGTFGFWGNPNLQYICADEGQITSIQTLINDPGYTNPGCVVNSYCSFTPGGTVYYVQGNVRYDSNSNGCDVSDINCPLFKFSSTDISSNVSNFFTNNSGSYSFPVSSGTYTQSPVLENPTYFNITPTSFQVTFPTSSSPYTRDFCLTANGTHNDMEIAILPSNWARPGFDATYKIVYKNKGTNAQSGYINLTFNDGASDYVSSVPNFDVQTVNNLRWNFSNLAPFETREIYFTINLNTPLETPPINSGDVLNYTVSVNGLTDETPIDNSLTFNQTVINAHDPNDKTCIEGTTVSQAMVGQYVHYVIRFENTGTANAQNIVVKDIINTAKYDVTSLVPLSGSAAYTTKRSNTNQVEFIFQNINLPYTSGTNTGYVAFKIKTKPTLIVGNTFSNSASIFFDYNAPIVTNTYTTTITALATQDFDFGTYFSVYPNPAKHVLNMETKAEIEVKSINIYNLLGQMVIAIPNAESVSSIDVSDLKTGTYFIKVNTDKGTANAKFIKE